MSPKITPARSSTARSRPSPPPPHRARKFALAGFGRFKVADRPERQGRNPATGEPITIAASKKLSFTPAKALRDVLNQTPTKNATKAA
jgi:hypothetical protein